MIDAHTLTLRLGGHWYRHYGAAPCPVCQPEGRLGQNALTLNDGGEGLLLHCKKLGCDFCDILKAAGIAYGGYSPPNPTEVIRRQTERRAETLRRALCAAFLWKETVPIGNTIAETYLRGRGITCDLPATLRFHPACWHGPTATRHPALVAQVDGSKAFAVHRTYLDQEGSGKAAIEPDKAMLGAVAGGAVQLIEATGVLAVAEGIETTLSLSCGLLQAPATIWAALSTSGIRGLRLPQIPSRLTIAPDGDEAGRGAAQALASRAHALGWQVSLLPAPDGCDWNDILTMKGDSA